jgi:hypothetical protein
MKVKLIEFFSLLFLCIITSVFWGSWFIASRVIDHFDSTALVTQVHIFELTFPMPMRILTPLTLILMALLLTQENQKWPGRLTWLSLILLVSAILYTFVVVIPADRSITNWSWATLPADWKAMRAEWKNDQFYRAVICLFSMCSLIGSLLTKKPVKITEYSIRGQDRL